MRPPDAVTGLAGPASTAGPAGIAGPADPAARPGGLARRAEAP